MSKLVIISILIIIPIAALLYVQLSQPSVTQLQEEVPNQTEPETNTEPEVEPEAQDVYIVEVEIGDSANDLGVYVITTTGEKLKIAQSDNPETIENYFDIETYHEAFISPNNKFVALEGSRFEDGFVKVYAVETNTLYDEQWGYVDEWTSDGLLKVDACDLSGEVCTYLISRDANRPWEFIERTTN